jgi:HK97 gp10 family phage protein
VIGVAFDKIHIEGLKELDRKLQELPDDLQRKVLRDALKAGADPILTDAKASAPVKTGALRASLRATASRSRKHGVTVQVITKDGFFKGEQFYGAFLEYGTRFIKARAFIAGAFDKNKHRALGLITRSIASGLVRAARRRG